MAWIFLIIAAAFEAAWTFSLKLMKFSQLKTLQWHTFYLPAGLYIWLPFAGYIIFGVGNIYFFSLAIKNVPTAVAYAVWTAVTLVLIKVSEITFMQQRISYHEIFFMLLIMGGIIGLKYYAPAAQ
ncbi:quaternary ammonium compound-resistance protein SugE [Mucilaginibacter yixingensis]|uniref:Quaternary ammonium compound-resistance protein SugE n=1 Tax=Mucilaginibacter yixingensis TaxID=1295612 RepID=A0A2T5JFC3_9SPHI|nr:SMR family transporter [Mucilaginibacter yixingensis]PTR01119.1 quaternary ammonium compound-resistance protein SugE [Mucilaginibacter yixingensis]